MEITTKSGLKLEIAITGFQQEPKIELVTPLNVQGRTIAGTGMIQHWKSKGAEEGLYFRVGDAYIQCAHAMPAIREEISKLPKRVYQIYQRPVQYNCDGDIVDSYKWIHEQHVRGAQEYEIEALMTKAGLTEMTVDEAQMMWDKYIAEKRAPYIEAAKAAGKPVEYRREIVECSDAREECSADIAITYLHADGTMHTEYNHTW